MPVELVENAETFTLSARERRACTELLETLARSLALRLPVDLELIHLDVVITRRQQAVAATEQERCPFNA